MGIKTLSRPLLPGGAMFEAVAHRVDLFKVLPWIALAVVGWLTVMPLLAMLLITFRPQDATPFDPTAGWTLEWYPRVFLDFTTYSLLWNTLIYAVVVIVLALPLALFFAWLMERTDFPRKNLIYSLMIVSLVLPGFFVALAWIQMAGPNAGFFNVYLRNIFDLGVTRGPLNIFTWGGMIFVTVLSIVPPMWLLLLGLFRNMDPALEDAAATAGAGRVSTVRRITLPLMRPGIVTVLIYYMMVLTEIFEIPIIIGLTAGVRVLSVQVFLLTTGGEGSVGLPVYGLAATFGLIGLFLGTVLIALYLYAVRRQEKFAVVTGKGYRPATVELGRMKWICFAIFGTYVFLKIILPVLIVTWTSLQPRFVVPSLDSLSTLTLANYTDMLQSRMMRRMLINSAIVPVASAFVTMFLATFIAWLAVRRPTRVMKVVNAMTFIPLAVPNPVLVLAILVFYITSPLPIYGTLWILILAFATRYIAFATRLMHAAQLQLDKSLDEASYTSGVGPWRTFYHINVRLLLPAFFNGWIWVFSHAMRDWVVPLYLASATTVLIANMIFQRYTFGDQEVASAFMVVMFVVIIVVSLVTRRFATQGPGRV